MTRRPLLAMGALLLALLLGLTGAARAATPAQIASGLERSPLYVDPALAESVPAAKRRAVVAAIEKAPERVLVALVPLTAGDRYGGDSGRFLDVVHGRVGRDAVYVTVDEGLLRARGYGIDDQALMLSDASTVANFEAEDFDEPAVDKVLRLVRALGDPRLPARVEKVDERLDRRRSSGPVRPDDQTQAEAEADGGPGTLTLLAIAAALLLVGALGVRWWRRRHARPAPADEPLVPRRIFEHARTARAEELREDIEERLVRFSETIDARPTPHRPAAVEAQQHGLDAYTAARRVLQSDPEMVDLTGALVLVHMGAAALARAEAIEAGRTPRASAPLCFFDPRHGEADGEITRDLGVRVPACATCRQDLRSGRAPAALLDDGEPWFERDSVWAQTGFGVFSDKLVERILTRGLRR